MLIVPQIRQPVKYGIGQDLSNTTAFPPILVIFRNSTRISCRRIGVTSRGISKYTSRARFVLWSTVTGSHSGKRSLINSLIGTLIVPITIPLTHRRLLPRTSVARNFGSSLTDRHEKPADIASGFAIQQREYSHRRRGIDKFDPNSIIAKRLGKII